MARSRPQNPLLAPAPTPGEKRGAIGRSAYQTLRGAILDCEAIECRAAERATQAPAAQRNVVPTVSLSADGAPGCRSTAKGQSAVRFFSRTTRSHLWNSSRRNCRA